TIGTVYLIFWYTEMLRQPTEQIRNEVQDLQQADAGIGRIEGLLHTAPRLVDGSHVALPPGPLAVEFDGVSFGYDDGATRNEERETMNGSPTDGASSLIAHRSSFDMVLHNISFRIEPGRVLGVVGRTGSGKTTLTRLLPRFYDPSAGAVRLGGVDLRAVR